MDIAVDVRWLVQLALISLLVTAVGAAAFRRDAPTRRAFAVLALGVLALMPGVLLVSPAWSWPLIVDEPGAWNALWTTPLPPTLVTAGVIAMVALVVRVAVQAVRARQDIRACVACDDRRANDLVVSLARRGGLGQRRPTLRLSDRYDPCCSPWGLDVVLPPRALQWPDTTLEAVLAHEIVHLRRRDGPMLLAFRLLLAAYWFLPWLHVLYRRYVQAIEETCDDRAARLCESDLAYVESLAAVARELGSPERRADASAARVLPAMSRHVLPARIRRFLDARAQELSVPVIYWSFVAVLFVGAVAANVTFEPRADSVEYPAATVSIHVPPATAIGPGDGRVPFVDVVVESSPVRRTLGAPLRSALPRPIYPGHALRAGVEGDAVVRFDVGPQGSILRPAIVVSDPPSLGEAVMRALDASGATPWRTAPGLEPGHYRIRYRFRIADTSVHDSRAASPSSGD